MRDAFGGTFMIQIFLVFIMIYIGFTALALNYAKAFKVKNAVIDYLETNEIVIDDILSSDEQKEIDQFINDHILGEMHYNLSANNICNIGGTDSTLLINDENNVYGYCHQAGIKIELSGEGANNIGSYYTVSSYLGWSMPFLNGLLSLNGNNRTRDVPAGLWKISGQTRLIVNE